jgi:hypothetical protein
MTDSAVDKPDPEAAPVRAFITRWAPIFGESPLFKHVIAAYRAAWDDDSDAGYLDMRAIVQDLYDQAVAAGHDVSQTCPKCKAMVSCARELDYYDPCDACVAVAEAARAAEAAARAEAEARHERWLASLSSEEREMHRAREAAAAYYTINGLIQRNVV